MIFLREVRQLRDNKNEYISIEEICLQTGMSKATLYRKLKRINLQLKKEKIQRQGKSLLYHFSIINDLTKNETIETVEKEKIIKSPPISIKKEVEILKAELEENKKIVIEKDFFIKDIINQLSKKDDIIAEKDNRHDTIIMTLSKQLEALNNQLLLIEDKTKKPEGFFKSYGPIINQVLIFFLIIFIYVKILFL